LFSDHYLDATLPEHPDWEALEEKARAVMDRIGGLRLVHPERQRGADGEGPSASALMLLGHDYEVQPALETPDGTKRPDYVLYKDAVAVAANKNRPLNDGLLRGSAFAVDDAKHWDRPLDVQLKKGSNQFTNKKVPKYKKRRSP
jgi:hypothetical protein